MAGRGPLDLTLAPLGACLQKGGMTRGSSGERLFLAFASGSRGTGTVIRE